MDKCPVLNVNILAEYLRVLQVLPALLEYVREEEGAWVYGAKAKHAEVPLQCGGLCNNTPWLWSPYTLQDYK